MATLPSFLQLMESLGLDKPAPKLPSAARARRSHSIPSLRTDGSHRYSPYGTTLAATRRGSLPSIVPTNRDLETSVRSYSTSPSPLSSPRPRRRRVIANLSVNVYDSTSDLSASTPISSYVRRKTPQSSPISPSFTPDSFDSPATSPMPFILPTLPPLLCQLSSASDSCPPTPNTDDGAGDDDDDDGSLAYPPKPLPEFVEEPFIRRSYRHGVRISTPPRSADLIDQYRRRHIGAVA